MQTQALRPGTTVGDYAIEGQIASGGMGQVYLARHVVYGHRVAIKVLHPQLRYDPEWRRRFEQEGHIGIRLKHPNILSAREILPYGGTLALVLDLAREGQTLGRIVSRQYEHGIGLASGLDLFLQLLGGMEYLHQQAIVHGDVKPDNVLIEGDPREPRSWVPKVTDFGTVALIAEPIEIDGRPAVVVTPAYASPEHLEGVDRLEVSSDIYSLGLLFHYILTGRHASTARSVEEAAARVAMPVPILHLVNAPEPVIRLFQRMVAQGANQRYDSVRSLALAVRAVRESLGLRSISLFAPPSDETVPSELETVVDGGTGEARSPSVVSTEDGAPGTGGLVAVPARPHGLLGAALALFRRRRG